MKKITLLLFFALISLTSFAQEGVEMSFVEDFEGSSELPEGWDVQSPRGSCEFEIGTDFPDGESFESQGAIFDDVACSDAHTTAALITAEYDLSRATSATVTFDLVFQEDQDETQGGEILVIQVFDEFTGTEVGFLDEFNDSLEGIETMTYDISAYVSETTSLRFTYNNQNTPGAYAGVDNFVIDAVLSTDDNNTIEGFQMFPNPATNELNISSSNNIDNVTVFNMLGQVVIDQTVGATSQSINVSALQTGAYLLQVTANGRTGTYKFAKR